ncbi:glutathione S-transferase family protein [Pseudooceanicola sp. LIPI14-2-Ac024]|uniref:glutathione S-transferase family protein n=1 Tax=Pseudooceanicola sp. LIPI14-2-Ac024 TaxID=3344875 RepID=UPI0035D069F8
MSGLTLHGFHYSVYSRAARLVLHHRDLDHDWVEVNPFRADKGRGPHPMHRVPVLDHDGFRLFETAAILTYVATAFPGDTLIPEDPKARARMVQVQGIVDAYAYWPMVRQVYSAGVFAPAIGTPRDEDEVATGLAAAAPVLAMLDAIAGEGRVLAEQTLTLADLHLAPMVAAFTAAPEGAEAVARHPAVMLWWDWMRNRPEMAATDPGLPRKS